MSPEKSVAICSATRLRHPIEVMDVLARISEDDLQGKEHVVVKCGEQLWSALQSELSVRDSILRRFQNYKVHVLFPNSQSKSIEARTLENPDILSLAIDPLRWLDIGTCIRNNGQLAFHQVPGFSFIAPSGRACENFFRVGNLLTNWASVDTLSFWIADIALRSTVVLLDTWQISPIVYQAFALVRRLASVFALECHPFHDLEEARIVVENALQRMDSHDRLSTVISVTSSGHVENTLSSLFVGVGRSDLAKEVTAIFAMSDTSSKVPHLFKLAEQANPSVEIEGIPIKIDPRVFYPKVGVEEVGTFKAELLGLDRDNDFAEVDETRKLIDEMSLVPGLLGLHVQRGNRHFSFFVDGPKLFVTSAYVTKIRNLLPTFVAECRPDYLISGFGYGAKEFADLIGRLLELPSYTIRELSSQHLDKLRSKQVWIVEGVTHSGETIRKDINELRGAGAFFEKCLVVAGLVLGPKNRIRKLESAYNGGTPWLQSFKAAQFMQIGIGDSTGCPWCSEYRFLTEMEGSFVQDTPEWLVNRLWKLQRVSGIDGEPFFSIDGELLKVGGGSQIFPADWPAKALIFFLGIGMQRFRDEDAKARQRSFLTPRVVNPECLNRYSEAIIQAAFLRLVSPNEWGWQHQTQIREDLVTTTRNEGASFAFEMLIALNRRSILPRAEAPLEIEIQRKLGNLPGYSGSFS